MRSPSLDFALWAILRMSQFAPGELVLLAQEKVPKEKGTRCPRRLAPIPCVPRQTGRRAQLGAMTGSPIPSWLASNRARSFSPVWLRYSARATGPGAPSRKPVGAAEHRSRFGIKRVALFELDLLAERRGKCCEFGERPNRREAQGTRVSGQASGAAFLLATFLWRSKEKYLAVRAKSDFKSHSGI